MCIMKYLWWPQTVGSMWSCRLDSTDRSVWYLNLDFFKTLCLAPQKPHVWFSTPALHVGSYNFLIFHDLVPADNVYHVSKCLVSFPFWYIRNKGLYFQKRSRQTQMLALLVNWFIWRPTWICRGSSTYSESSNSKRLHEDIRVSSFTHPTSATHC